MNDLTKQWRREKLPKDCCYYIKLIDIEGGKIVTDKYTNFLVWDYHEWWQIEEVLAPVPSYDEWKAVQEQLHKEGIWYTEISHKKVLKENAELKELLKECSPYVSRSATSRMTKNSVGFKKDMKLLTKIDEVLNA